MCLLALIVRAARQLRTFHVSRGNGRKTESFPFVIDSDEMQ